MDFKGGTMDGIQFLVYYRSLRDFYLPMVDHESRVFEDRNEFGDVNIGWNCGSIDNRPYFLEVWAADGITMMTVFVSTIGIEDYTLEDIEELLIKKGKIYSKKEGYMNPEFPRFVDHSGNEFYSINIVVGLPDEPAVIEGGKIYPFSELNRLNGI